MKNTYIIALEKFLLKVGFTNIETYQNSLKIKLKKGDILFFIHKGWLKFNDKFKVMLKNVYSVFRFVKKFLKYLDEKDKLLKLEKLDEIKNILRTKKSTKMVGKDIIGIVFKGYLRVFFNPKRNNKTLRIRALESVPKKILIDIIVKMNKLFGLNLKKESDVNLTRVKHAFMV